MYKLYTDGSHAHEIDIAGIGGILYDESGKEVWRFSEDLNTFKDQHELMALKYGLSKAFKTGIKSIRCYTDCLNVVKFFKNKSFTDQTYIFQNFDNNAHLKQDIYKLASKFEEIYFSYVPRKENKKADWLSRKNLLKVIQEKSRTDIVKENNPEKFFFQCEAIKCIEKYTGNEKNKYLESKKDITSHYLFDKYIVEEKSYVDVYRVEKEQIINSKKIKTYELSKDNTINFLDIITKTLEENKEQNIVLIIKKDSDADLILRGMKSISSKIVTAFDKFKKVAQTKNSIFLESNGPVYEAIFPIQIKPVVTDKKNFYLQAIKKLGENYKLGDCPEIENYFELPTSKANNVIEIQKKYFGEFIRMMSMQAMMATEKEIFNFKDVKESLIKKGINFTY